MRSFRNFVKSMQLRRNIAPKQMNSFISRRLGYEYTGLEKLKCDRKYCSDVRNYLAAKYVICSIRTGGVFTRCCILSRCSSLCKELYRYHHGAEECPDRIFMLHRPTRMRTPVPANDFSASADRGNSMNVNAKQECIISWMQDSESEGPGESAGET